MLTFWLFLFISSCLQFVFGTPAHTKDIQEIVLKFNIRDQEESYNVIAYQSVKIALEKHTKKNGTGLSLNTRLEWCGNKYALFKNNKTNNVMIIGQVTPEMSGNWSCIINIDNKATAFINYRFKMNVVVSNVSASSEDNQSNSVSKSSDRPKPSEVLVGIPIKLTARHDNSEIICTCSRKGFPANILSVTLLLNIFKNQHSANNIALNITTNRHSEVKCLIGYNKYIRPPGVTTIFKPVIFEDFSSLFTVFRDTDDSIDRYILKTSNVDGDKLHEETESFVYHHNDNDMIDSRSSSDNASMKDFSMGLYGKWIIIFVFLIILLSICALLCKSYCYRSKSNLCDNSPNLQEQRPPVLLPESSTEESLCDNTEVSKRNQDIYCYVTAPVARFFPEDSVSVDGRQSTYENKAIYRLHRDENLK